MANTFISWSGERSRIVGKALRDWIQLVVPSAEPWMSDVDIHSGSRWFEAIERELADARFGILCLTTENVARPWLMFEAGALARAVSHVPGEPVELGRVAPYVIADLDFGGLAGPMSKFQARKADREGTKRLVTDIARVFGDDLGLVETRFEDSWTRLEKVLDQDDLAEPPEGEDSPTPPSAGANAMVLGEIRALRALVEQEGGRQLVDVVGRWAERERAPSTSMLKRAHHRLDGLGVSNTTTTALDGAWEISSDGVVLAHGDARRINYSAVARELAADAKKLLPMEVTGAPE